MSTTPLSSELLLIRISEYIKNPTALSCKILEQYREVLVNMYTTGQALLGDDTGAFLGRCCGDY
jgi:hypothetical protein